jgi:hypothetical protein
MEPESLKIDKMGENKGKKIALVVIADVSSGEGKYYFRMGGVIMISDQIMLQTLPPNEKLN